MHKEILTEDQLELLPMVRSFSKNFGLVGGTAIALYIGHRRSIDFDLFTYQEFDNNKIRGRISKYSKIDRVLKDEKDQYTFIIRDVMVTFFRYPYRIKFSRSFGGVINVPDLLTLAAMKAFALGRRAKWKDYVDLFFVMKDRHTIDQISKKAKKIFGNEFNEKIFRMQLAYFKDINYSEKVIYLKGFEIGDAVIKKALSKFSLF